MSRKRGLIKLLPCFAVLIFCVLATAMDVQADPLQFSNVTALQNSGLSTFDLFSNPTLKLFGPQISFTVDVAGVMPPGATDTLSITFLESGQAPQTQTFSIPLFGTNQPPFTVLFTFTPVNPTYDGTQASILIDILKSNPDFTIPSGVNSGQHVDSFSFAFKVAQPVPEPATATLLGLGICGVIGAVHRRRRK